MIDQIDYLVYHVCLYSIEYLVLYCVLAEVSVQILLTTCGLISDPISDTEENKYVILISIVK